MLLWARADSILALHIPDPLEKARDFRTVTASEVALGLGAEEICRRIRNKGS